ncbi:MAG: radical SAM protein [Thaumarchaeota archaeon]|nr:radical SAM protein [Nitrososphaerota archaeon]
MTLISIQPPSTLPDSDGNGISIRETRCTTLLHRLEFGSSTGYTANLYKGCIHGCAYCYAPSLTHDERKWGRYVDVKVNAPEVLERELRGIRKDQVFLSSASDPYQPVEAKYGITRRCLESLLRNGFPVSILTRSPLVLRDLELLRKFDWVKVGMSITTVPVRQFEPGVPPLERRIVTLRKLAEAGIRTWVSLAPVIPGIMMVDLDQLFEDLSDAGVSSVSFGILRFTGYEESKKMFEEAARMSTAEALVGRDDVVARLSDLVKRYGLESTDGSTEWKPKRNDFPSLDTFCN